MALKLTNVEFASDQKCHEVAKDQGQEGSCYLYSFINMFANERVILHALKKLIGWEEDLDQHGKAIRGKCTHPTPKPIVEIVKILTHFKYSVDTGSASCPLIPKWMRYYILGKEGGIGTPPDGGHTEQFVAYTLLACEKIYPERFITYLDHREIKKDDFDENLKRMCEEFKRGKCTVGWCRFDFEPFECTAKFLEKLTSYPCVRSFSLSISKGDKDHRSEHHDINGYICKKANETKIQLCNTWGNGCLDTEKGVEEMNKREEYAPKPWGPPDNPDCQNCFSRCDDKDGCIFYLSYNLGSISLLLRSET